MTTHLIRSLRSAQGIQPGGVVTIGNFDGVHRGHQRLLALLVDKAKRLRVPATVVTFEPHPVEFFSGEKLSVPRLMTLTEKYQALADCGIDQIVVLRFNQELARLTAEDFVMTWLVAGLRPRHFLIGDDFRFGYGRRGDLALLKKLGSQAGFTVEDLSTVCLDEERISSTRIRGALAAGDFTVAERLLGRPYSMQAKVIYGNQLGRALGFPTANLSIHRRLAPLHGIYAVYVHGPFKEAQRGVASIGTRPAVLGTHTLLEVHLLDWEESLYGQRLRIEFCQKLRDEANFPSLAALKAQIAQDVAIAERYFMPRGC